MTYNEFSKIDFSNKTLEEIKKIVEEEKKKSDALKDWEPID